MAGGPFRTPRHTVLDEEEAPAVPPLAAGMPIETERVERPRETERAEEVPAPSPPSAAAERRSERAPASRTAAPPEPQPEATQELAVTATPETNGSEASDGSPRRSSLFGFRKRKERTP